MSDAPRTPANDPSIPVFVPPDWLKELTNSSTKMEGGDTYLSLANYTGTLPGLNVNSFGSIMAIVAIALVFCVMGTLLGFCFLRRRGPSAARAPSF
jgi:hypothetical protein